MPFFRQNFHYNTEKKFKFITTTIRINMKPMQKVNIHSTHTDFGIVSLYLLCVCEEREGEREFFFVEMF